MQAITSAKTSLNQVPALHRKLSDDGLIFGGETILDYGCGAYDTGMQFLTDEGFTVIGCDKYNRTPMYNSAAMAVLEAGQVDVVICANVLNVIAEPEARAAVMQDCAKAVNRVFFSVYEGDRSGTGKETTKGWQNNRKLADYIEELDVYFYVSRIGNVLECIPKRGQ